MTAEQGPANPSRKPPKKPLRDALGAYPTGYPAPVDRVIDELGSLPGIGRRSAERMALYLLKSPEDKVNALASAIADLKRTVRNCRVCYNLTDTDLCAVCANESRERHCVLVVEQPRDVLALETTGVYKGLYHVLLGRLSPLDNVGPGDLTIPALLDRLRDAAHNAGAVPIREVILGLNPTLEGDGTALYLAEQLKRFKSLKVNRLARGLPTGTQLEHANKAILADAIQGRRAME